MTVSTSLLSATTKVVLAIDRAAPADLTADGLVLALAEGERGRNHALDAADRASGGLVKTVIASGDFRGKAGEILVVQAPGQAVRRVVLCGLGKPDKVTLESLRNAAGRGATSLRDLGVRAVTVALPLPTEVPWAGGTPAADAIAQAVAEGAHMALFKFDNYTTKKKEDSGVERVVLWTPPGFPEDLADRGVATATVIVESIAVVRALVLHPANVLTPAVLADEARAIAAEVGLEATIWGMDELREKGFGGILTVNKGSRHEPRFIILEWKGGPAGQAPVAIVGKGITFDTGGIGIKPPNGMEKMKYDMAGGGATIGILRAVALLRLPLNVIGVVPATENMVGARAANPGDVYTAYGGTTVEFNDTDAEGRVVLADALAYLADKVKPQAMIDMATLTGAVAIALGREVMGVMGNDQRVVDRVIAAGERSGERGWQLPLFDAYDDVLKSDFADFKNYSGRDAGTITAAAFLKQFVGGIPWCHLDVAGTAWSDRDRPYRPKGPTGAPLRLVVDALRRWESF